MEGINKRIRAFRKLKGLTQIELAEKIGISVAILGSIERGTRTPDLPTLEKISRILELSIEEIIQKG